MMALIHLTQGAKNLGGFVSKNSSIILTMAALGGLGTTAYLAAKATPKAIYLLEQEEEYRKEISINDDWEPLTKKDILQITWRLYLPALCVGIATGACIIGIHSVNARRIAGVTSLYTITDAAFREYRQKVTDTIGRAKEERVRDDISADKIRSNPPGQSEVIFTGKGEVLCYDAWSGRYFKSDIEQIRKAVNVLNKELLTDMFVTLNELYFTIGLGSIKMGDEMGWDLDKGLLEIDYSAQLTEDGEPCIVLNYAVSPKFMRGR